MSDGYVQAPADSIGKRVDADETTNTSGLTVERLRVAVPDGVNVRGDLLQLIYSEVQTTSYLLAEAFRLGDMLRSLRGD